MIDSKQRVWSHRRNLNKLEVYNLNTKKRIASHKIHLITNNFFEDKQGNIWVSDKYNGLLKLRLEDTPNSKK